MNSVIPGFGRGIYAGKNYYVDDTIEISPSLLVKNEFAMENQLQYFVYATEDEYYDAIVFGEGMMYNSLDAENAAHEWATELPGYDSLYDQPFTNYSFFRYTVQKPVRIGEEFFVNYGNEWFTQRSQKPKTANEILKRRYSTIEMYKYGFCLSDVYVADSLIPIAGKGLFSKKSYVPGDTVTISPVLILPREDVESTADSSVLINYCLTSDRSVVAMLPISIAGMINHGGIASNVQILWENDTSTAENLQIPVSLLGSLSFAPLTIKFIATRPISIGEEITMSYGQVWEKKWLEYLSSLQVWIKKYPGLGHYMKPQFRQMIEAPSELFPPTFYGECFGKRCSPNLENAIVEPNEDMLGKAFRYADANFIFKSGERCITTEN